MLRFKEHYNKNKESLLATLGLTNKMQIPAINKIVLNMGVGNAVLDKNEIDSALNELTMIAGQKPMVMKAKKSIATFKLREGMPVGIKVTLRGAKMYEFLERLILITLPRDRSFRGFNMKSFDGKGNFNLGIKEHILFPEIDYDKVSKVRGLDIAIVTSATNDIQAKELLKLFYFPFVN